MRIFLEVFDEAGAMIASTFAPSDEMMMVPARHLLAEFDLHIGGIRVTLAQSGVLDPGTVVDMVRSHDDTPRVRPVPTCEDR